MIVGQNFKQKVSTESDLLAGYDNIYENEAMAADEICFYKKVVAIVLKYVNKGRLLDISCGRGFVVDIARQKGFQSCGLDLAPKAIELASKMYPECSFVQGSSERLPFYDCEFDVITNLGSLEHYLDMEIAIRESVRVLKDTGIAIYMMPNQYFLPSIIKVLFRGDPNDKLQPIERFASKIEWKGLLENNGLKVLKIEKYNQKAKGKGLLGFIYNSFIFTIPFNLSYCLIYICKKNLTEE
jgi:2-polyprenyl-3-methyl-5-hydroxy-6-metoxy-1,4-benzoquinol methylase